MCIQQKGNKTYMNIYKYFIRITMLLGMLSCSTRPIGNSIVAQLDYQDVDSIRFWYMAPGLVFCAPVQNFKNLARVDDTTKDTLLTDRETIRKFITYLKELEPTGSKLRRGYRVASRIHAGNDTILACFYYPNPRRWTDVDMLLEDTPMKPNKRMVKLLDSMLYRHMTLRDWMPSFLIGTPDSLLPFPEKLDSWCEY